MRLQDFPDEETVFADLAAVVELAFEVGVTLLDQRSIDLGTVTSVSPNFANLSVSAPLQLPMAITSFRTDLPSKAWHIA